MPFPAAQQGDLPACSPHCPFNAEREAGKLQNTNFKVIGLTQLEIKSKFTASEADALTTRPSEPLNYINKTFNNGFVQSTIYTLIICFC